MSDTSSSRRRLLATCGALATALLSGCAAGYDRYDRYDGYGGGYGGGYREPGDWRDRDRDTWRGGRRGPGGGGYDDGRSRPDIARDAYERDLERRVTDAIQSSPDPRAKVYNLKVTAQGDGSVLISGSPADGMMGRAVIQRIAERVPGVRSVGLNLVVN